MKKIFLLVVPLLGLVLADYVEASGRFSKCGKGMEAVYSPDAGRTFCRPRKVKPPEPPKAPEPALPPMTIDRFEPKSIFGGDEITIYGSGFTPGRIATVDVGGARSYVTIVSPTVLKTVVNTVAKTGFVTLVPNKGPSVSSSQKLEVRTELVLTKVEPAQAKPGSFINIYAKGGPQHERCKVYISGAHQSTQLYAAGRAMDVMIPKDAKNSEIFVDCEGGVQARSSTLFTLLITGPKIFAVAPEEVMVEEDLILHGQDFMGISDTHVFIGGEEVGIRRSEEKKLIVGPRRGAKNPKITVKTPSGEGELTPKLRVWSGVCSLTQINQAFEELLQRKPRGDGNEGQCNPADYRNGKWANYEDLKFAVRQRYGYASKPGPKISGVSPTQALPDEWITISGQNFNELQTIIIGSNASSQTERLSSNQLRAKIPVGAGSGSITIATLHGSATWNNFTVLKPPPPPPPAPITPPKPDPVTKNALGNPEYCFGAVGKGCGGFGDLKDDDKNATRPLWLAAGCSEEVNGMRRCWVVPGSIKHDNCCVIHPHGKHCGGPMSDGSNAGEWNHDKNCEKEWDDAVWDVKNGRGWEVDFVAKQPGDLTPDTSPMGRYAGGERAGTVNLCAANGASISARHHLAFCCSGTGQKYWALGVEDWYICGPKSGGRRVQDIAEKKEGTPTGVDMTKTPSKPGEPKIKPIALASKPPLPVITGVEKTKVEPEEIVTIYGKNFITEVNGKKEINFKELALVQDKTQKIVIANAGKNRGDEQSVFFWAPKEATGSYSLKILANSNEIVAWNNPLITVAKKEPPIPVITAVDKTKVEPEEIVTIYGKNLVTREKGKFKEYNFRQLSLVQGKVDKAMVYNVGKGRGDEDSVFFMVPKEVTGTYAIKLYVKPNVNVRWENPPLTVAKKTPPLPVLTRVSKIELEPGEALIVYGKNLIKQDASGFTSMNFAKMFFTKDKADSRVMAITSGLKKGDEESLNISAPKEPGSYFIKVVDPTGAVLSLYDKPALAVISMSPIITSVAKTEVEPEEIVTVYGKNFITKVNGKKEINFKELALVQGNKQKVVIANAGKNRGEEQSVFFMVPKEASGSYTLKIWAKTDEKVTWDKPPLTVAKKAPPIPAITGVSKNKVEVGESLSLYGKNLIAQDASGFTSMNFSKMFFVEGGVDHRVTAIVGGPAKGKDQSIQFSAPKKSGSYSIKIVAKSGEIVTWNNPMVAVVDTAAEKQKEIQQAVKQLPPPPQPSSEEPHVTPPPQEEEPAVARQEPQEEQHFCAQGTWSPTLHVCVEDQAPEEMAPPDCGAGMHWSPTLKSCQAD